MADEIINGLIERQVEKALEQIVDAAVAAERKRCAKVAQMYPSPHAALIAAAIRKGEAA